MHLRLLAAAGFAGTLASAGTLSVPFTRRNIRHQVSNLAKRDGTITIEALNNITGGGYYAELEIGTPGQKLTFMLDTGSSDTWVNAADADLCSDQSRQDVEGYCLTRFNSDDSSTFAMVTEGAFNITYLDNRHIQGDYFNDTVTINGYEIKNQQLGLAHQTSHPTGIMGLGFKTNVAAKNIYPTVLDNMVTDGYLATRAFSLYLNDMDSNTGIVLFGGVDKEKYTGDLTTIPLISNSWTSSDLIKSFTVPLSGFHLNGPSSSKSFTMSSKDVSAVLDSGGTYSLLPDDTATKVHQQLGIVYLRQLTLIPFVDCAYADAKGKDYTLEFQLGNGGAATIKVPLDEMIIDGYPKDVQQALALSVPEQFGKWSGVCMFGIGASSDYGVPESADFAILGDTFLRSAYVVYDLENKQIAIAQANLNSTKTDIHEISAGSDKIPGASGASSSASGSPSATGTGALETSPTDTAAGSSSHNDDEDNAAGRVSSALRTSIGAAVGMSCLTAGVVPMLLW